MAWYLLGKDYAEHGEMAKAKYCFIRAGEVYEAYEDTPLPEIVTGRPLDKSDNPLREQDAKAASSWRKSWKWMLAWVAMVLLFVQTDYAVENNAKDEQEQAVAGNQGASNTSAETQATSAQTEGNGSGAKIKPQTVVYYAEGNLASVKRQSDLISPILSEVMDQAPLALLVQAPHVGKDWIDWQAEPKLLFSAEQTIEAASAYKVSAYDREMCACEPGDASAVKNQFNEWKNEEEQRMIARSAVKGYESVKGKPPETPDQLTLDYPNNYLSGLTPLMRAEVQQLINEASASSNTNSASAQQPSGSLTQSSAPQAISSTQLLNEPLAIVIDKSNYRLALVSGGVIVRSYPVGLGGPRTPEGEFTISEKVRSPNGRDNGEFGSRGMTLSDTLFAIHGTNQPTSINADRSQGCIRMLKGDVEELFDMVPMGTKVTIGSGMLPPEILRSESPFSLPAQGNEKNPGKVYRWLN
jgi:lipoprotein-anchoring transpeptidase ErfK/SrfK